MRAKFPCRTCLVFPVCRNKEEVFCEQLYYFYLFPTKGHYPSTSALYMRRRIISTAFGRKIKAFANAVDIDGRGLWIRFQER